jgi:hypothetical protein
MATNAITPTGDITVDVQTETIVAPQLSLFNRPAMKEAGGDAQPAYSEDVKAARERLSEKLTAVLQEELGTSGAFCTLNNKGDKWMVSQIIPIGELHFTDPQGKLRHTRTSNLNINALWAADEATNKADASPVTIPAMTFEEMEESRKKAVAARKAAK